MSRDSFRRHLSMPGMPAAVRERFDRIADPTVTRGISLSDCLMSGLAVFSLKIPSLPQSGTQVRGGGDPVQARNLRSPFGVARAPSDTWMRERLDGVDPRGLRRCFTGIHAALQRGKVLEGWTVFGGHLLISVDGTGYHSSHSVSCRNRCGRNHRNGTKTHYHQALGASVVHPDIGEVLPLAPEPIRKEDGSTRNDCERNAAKRLVGDLRREHPHMRAVIVDGLSSNGPHIRLRERKRISASYSERSRATTSCCSAGSGPAKPGRHGRGATGTARCTDSSGTADCRPTTPAST